MGYNPTVKWAYYIRGREIAIVTYKVGDNNNTFDWRTPTESINAGLQVQYTLSPAIPATAATDIDVSETLAQALIFYCKGCVAERAGKFDIAQYMFKHFYRMAALDNNNKRGGIRKLIPGGSAEVLK